MSSLPPRVSVFFDRQVELPALRIAQAAAAQVPAYAAFLRQAGYDPRRLNSSADFRDLPVMDKDTYLARYPIKQRSLRGDVAQATVVTLSSGSSGAATLWPRRSEQDIAMTAAFQEVLQEHFHIAGRRTLLVIGIPIGAWLAGTLMVGVGQRLFSQPGIAGAVVTPGPDPEAVLYFVERLSSQYDQTIFTGTALPVILAEGARRGINWRALNAGALMGGEWLSQERRERILQDLGRDPDRLEGFVGLFVSAEADGLIGYETRLCLLLRRLCVQTPALAQALFGSTVLPSIHQYDPRRVFLEVEAGEIVLTKPGPVPLVRYNTHDCGGLLTLEAVRQCCRDHGYDLVTELQARGLGPEALCTRPLLYVFGRSDAVIVQRANVSVHHVAHVLDGDELHVLTSGNFELGAATDADGRATLYVTVELREGVEATDAVRAQIQTRLVQGLLAVSSEFRDAYRSAPGRLAVDVELVPCGSFARGLKQHRRVRHPGDPVLRHPRQPTSGSAVPGDA
jgi:phenylacetate-CoA ligase